MKNKYGIVVQMSFNVLKWNRNVGDTRYNLKHAFKYCYLRK